MAVVDMFRAKSPVARENAYYKNWLKISGAVLEIKKDGEGFVATLSNVTFAEKEVENFGIGKTKTSATRDLFKRIRGQELHVGHESLEQKFNTPWFIR